jgi:DNA-binding transcriptional regulator YiaG
MNKFENSNVSFPENEKQPVTDSENFLSPEEFSDMLENMGISEEEFDNAMLQALNDIKCGNVYTLEEVDKMFDENITESENFLSPEEFSDMLENMGISEEEFYEKMQKSHNDWLNGKHYSPEEVLKILEENHQKDMAFFNLQLKKAG